MKLPGQRGPDSQPVPRSGYGPVVQRWVRRAHLYLGLLLWPFVLLFGITGLSFNHPTVGRGLQVERVAAHDVQAATGFRAWDAQRLAEDVVKQLGADGERYRLDAGARFAGFPLFAAPTAGGKQVVILSLSEGSASITRRLEPKAPPAPPFVEAEVQVPGYDVAQLAQQLTPLLQAHGFESQGPLRAHPEVHPELMFRVRDAAGRDWNTVYDLTTGKLSGALSDAPRQSALIALFESIHKQHHYPPHASATSWWALFADLTAATLIVWALTGLFMWWQLKRTRRTGAVVVALSLVSSVCVIGATARELSFVSDAQER
jgi:hypothetical protein